MPYWQDTPPGVQERLDQLAGLFVACREAFFDTAHPELTETSADALLDALALRGENLGGHTTRLTQLLERYGAAELDHAIADALARGASGAASVAHILDQRARARKA